ncbi:MAG: DUF6713 family protein [Spirulina sp.]
MSTILYYLCVSALLTHEMDAVMHSEWRLLYFLSNLSDATAYPIFIAIHFPIYFLFFWLGNAQNWRVRDGFRLLIALFSIVHAGLHFRLSDRANYEFHGLLSNSLIYSAAIFGLAYLLLGLYRWYFSKKALE